MFQKKQIFKLSILKKLLNDENACVSLVPSTRMLALPPFFLNDMKSGILYLLNCMLKKYDRSLGGIVIGYQNIKVLMDENTGIIPMGTPEIEVNISVEFYIFQPKIGSLLKGIINKKSNNHIGCLVHQYFNATILKPEDVDFDDWICKDFNVDDKIIFKVKDLDFTSLLPYIEGIVDENFIHRESSRNLENNDITGVNNEGVQSAHLLTRIQSQNFDSELFKDTKCPSSKREDNVLYSTQLEAKSESNMMVSFCSPIPHTSSGTTMDGKIDSGLLWISDFSLMQNGDGKSVGTEKEKKKKHKKRKKEEKDEVESVLKKAKISTDFVPEAEESNCIISKADKLIEELCKEKVNKTIGDLKGSDIVNLKKKSSKKDLKQQKKDVPNKNTVTSVSDFTGCNKSEEQIKFCEPYNQDFTCMTALSASNGDLVKKKSGEDMQIKSLTVKKKSKVQPSKIGSSGEEKAVEELANNYNIKGVKKQKTAENKKGVSREGTDDSLYEKILREAKSAVDLGKYTPSTSHSEKKADKMMSKKDNNLSIVDDLSTGSSSKKKHSRRKNKHKEKTKDRLRSPNKYRNGSMYDMSYSPEKVNPDKSLFSDSEQSNTSPAKRKKETNGVETIFEKKSNEVQKKLNIFCDESMAKVEDGQVSNDWNKNEKAEKTYSKKLQSSDQHKESLFQKLLEQAKRLIDIKGESHAEKKVKSGNGSRKKKPSTS